MTDMASSYVIIESSDPDALAKEVTKRLRKGWGLQAGVSTCVVLDVSHGIFRYHYAQALTKEIPVSRRSSRVGAGE